jgi:guanosine-diphosphatase
MRRTSVSLPTKHAARDPHEKPARYESGYQHRAENRGGILEKLQQAAGMNQAQKTRWLKTTAIVVFLVFLFYFLSPRGVDIYQDGTHAHSPQIQSARNKN